MADIRAIGGCEKCGSSRLTCKYNHFENDALSIHSWEHKCPDCGQRQTTAFRSDSPPLPDDPRLCPYCGRTGGF